MSLITVRCPVSQQTVVRVADLEGATTTLVCAEFDPATKNCRLKLHVGEGGPLTQLIERVAEHTLDRKSARCDLI